jgi:hypothetical protein
MFGDLLAFLVATFLLGPLQSQMADQLAAARAPAAVVRQVTDCATTATPRLIERAAGDPWWAVSTAFGAWIGTIRPEAVLGETTPGCAQAMQAARPYFTGS